MTVSEILEERIRRPDAPHGVASGLSLANCSVQDLSNCRLPGFGKMDPASEAARIEFTSINDQFGGVFGGDVLVCWAAMVAIIGVLGIAIVLLQKRKDTL